MLEIPQKGDFFLFKEISGNYIQVEPRYIGQMVACLLHLTTDIFNINNIMEIILGQQVPILIVICLW